MIITNSMNADRKRIIIKNSFLLIYKINRRNFRAPVLSFYNLWLGVGYPARFIYIWHHVEIHVLSLSIRYHNSTASPCEGSFSTSEYLHTSPFCRTLRVGVAYPFSSRLTTIVYRLISTIIFPLLTFF